MPSIREEALVGADKTESETRERAVSPTLEQEVMSALLDSEQSVDEIDELLTRCAAEALRLQADRRRTESAVRELEAERLRLFELVAEVRALRDRVIESDPGS
jgi:hypothetical protein